MSVINIYEEFPEMVGVWHQGMELLREKYWRKFRFDPDSDLAEYVVRDLVPPLKCDSSCNHPMISPMVKLSVYHDNSCHGEDAYVTRELPQQIVLDAVLDGATGRGGADASTFVPTCCVGLQSRTLTSSQISLIWPISGCSCAAKDGSF